MIETIELVVGITQKVAKGLILLIILPICFHFILEILIYCQINLMVSMKKYINKVNGKLVYNIDNHFELIERSD